MKKIGFICSSKENEKRRALVFDDIKKIRNRSYLYFEKNYFKDFNISDDKLLELGVNVLSKEDVLKCDIICDPKIGDALYLDKLNNQTIFGWIHATQNKEITDILIKQKLSCYAWEKMFENNVHTFYRNNQIAGIASVLHAIICYGKLPTNLNVAILGSGNTSTGAKEILEKLGARVRVFKRNEEELFKTLYREYDIIVNAVLWDVNRTDHILYRTDLSEMRPGSLIIDISCDHNGAIESSIPTSIEKPTYIVDGIMHYVVDHTPSLLFKDASESISKEIVKFLDDLIEEKENKILKDCLIIKNGVVIDEEINKYQGR